MHRRRFLQLAAAPALLPWSETFAQAYPTRSIDFIIPFPPGGPSDTAPRIALDFMAPILKASLIPINKPGAGGAIAAEAAARSTPDGYTVLASSNPPISLRPAFDSKLTYKLSDFAVLGMYSTDVSVMCVTPESGITSIEDLIARAKRKPDELSYASAGPATVTHIAAELFKSTADIKILHVPHRGSGPAVQAVLGGHVPILSSAYSAAAPLIESRKLIPLVTTSSKRISELPDLPTLAEKGLGDAALNIWMGFFVPAKTPPPVIAVLTDAVARIANNDSFKAVIRRAKLIPEYGDPAATRRQIDREMAVVAKLAERVPLGN